MKDASEIILYELGSDSKNFHGRVGGEEELSLIRVVT